MLPARPVDALVVDVALDNLADSYSSKPPILPSRIACAAFHDGGYIAM